MFIPSKGLSYDAAYRLLSGAVVPRPVAWVTTLSPTGVINLAPFSCFTFVSNLPPMVGINIGLRNGQLKDTARNIIGTGEFVVNIADESQTSLIHASGDAFAPDISEAVHLGLGTSPSAGIRTPRLAVAQVALICRFHQKIAFGQGGAEFFVGEVLSTYVRDDIYRDGKIDARLMRPVGRLGGPHYATIGEVISAR